MLVNLGAKALIPGDQFSIAKESVRLSLDCPCTDVSSQRGTAYVAPQVLINVDHCALPSLCVY